MDLNQLEKNEMGDKVCFTYHRQIQSKEHTRSVIEIQTLSNNAVLKYWI